MNDIFQETLCSLKITWKTAVRFFKWTEVYDGLAEVSPGDPNIDPGYTVVVKHFDSYEQAKEKAIDGLVDHLTKFGLLNGETNAKSSNNQNTKKNPSPSPRRHSVNLRRLIALKCRIDFVADQKES